MMLYNQHIRLSIVIFLIGVGLLVGPYMVSAQTKGFSSTPRYQVPQKIPVQPRIQPRVPKVLNIPKPNIPTMPKVSPGGPPKNIFTPPAIGPKAGSPGILTPTMPTVPQLGPGIFGGGKKPNLPSISGIGKFPQKQPTATPSQSGINTTPRTTLPSRKSQQLRDLILPDLSKGAGTNKGLLRAGDKSKYDGGTGDRSIRPIETQSIEKLQVLVPADLTLDLKGIAQSDPVAYREIETTLVDMKKAQAEFDTYTRQAGQAFNEIESIFKDAGLKTGDSFAISEWMREGGDPLGGPPGLMPGNGGLLVDATGGMGENGILLPPGTGTTIPGNIGGDRELPDVIGPVVGPDGNTFDPSRHPDGVSHEGDGQGTGGGGGGRPSSGGVYVHPIDPGIVNQEDDGETSSARASSSEQRASTTNTQNENEDPEDIILPPGGGLTLPDPDEDTKNIAEENFSLENFDPFGGDSSTGDGDPPPSNDPQMSPDMGDAIVENGGGNNSPPGDEKVAEASGASDNETSDATDCNGPHLDKDLGKLSEKERDSRLKAQDRTCPPVKKSLEDLDPYVQAKKKWADNLEQKRKRFQKNVERGKKKKQELEQLKNRLRNIQMAQLHRAIHRHDTDHADIPRRR